MKSQLVFCLLITLAGCSTLAKQQRKAEIFYMQHPEKLAAKCAERFPAKDSVGKTDTVYTKADNEDYTQTIDSLKSMVDSLSNSWIVITDSNCIEQYDALLKKNVQLKNSITTLQRSYKACKPDTLKLTDTIYTQSPGLLAANSYLTYQRDSSNKALISASALLADKKHAVTTDTWIIIALSVVIAGGTILKIKNLI